MMGLFDQDMDDVMAEKSEAIAEKIAGMTMESAKLRELAGDTIDPEKRDKLVAAIEKSTSKEERKQATRNLLGAIGDVGIRTIGKAVGL